MKISSVQFVKSIFKLKDKPFPYLPEFAFVGRSNVGKSSLINSLVKRKKLAHTSNTPGKTRSINYFVVNDLFYLVDLPGYGFAKVSKSERLQWQKMIEEYLLNSPELKVLFVLTDIRHGPQKSDLQLIEWLKANSIPYKIIATKADKLSKNAIQKNVRQLYQSVFSNPDQLFIYSAVTELGRLELLNFIASSVKK
jgi:GTP-binding protein